MHRSSTNGSSSTHSNDAYSQYRVNGAAPDIQPKQQRRAGKEWLPYSGQRQLIIAIDLGMSILVTKAFNSVDLHLTLLIDRNNI